MTHKVYCIIGRTASGKTTIVDAVANNLNMNILQSYTTRPRRSNEVGDNCGHTFISASEVDKYRPDMVAYTERVGYCSFATKQQLMDNDFYVINPSGFAELLNKTKNIPKLRLIDIWIRCDNDTLMKRAKRRDNYDDWFANFKKEEQEFMKFYPGVNYSYIVNNSGKLSDAIEEVQRIVQLEKYKD